MMIYMIAGEPSGDMLGARLIRALKVKDKQISFAGIGGENMEKEGLPSLFDITDLSVMGLVEVIPSIPKVLRRIRETVDDIIEKKPDVVITIDSWSFSARVHKALRKRGFKVLQMHYVAPQVWAWKKRRAKTMYKYIDHLLTLFPNEPKYFTPYNLPTDFVGHPVIEAPLDEMNKASLNIAKDKKLVLLLPGSRHNEVANLLPVFIDTARALQSVYKDVVFALPTVKTVEKRVKDIIKEKGFDVMVLTTREERLLAMKQAEMAIAASGTVALELAIANVPHLIAYRVPKLTAWLARHLTNIKYVNLTNLLLNKLVIPELLQEDCSKEILLKTSVELLDKTSALYEQEQAGFKELKEVIGVGKLKPSEKASEIILNLIKG